MFCIIVDVGDYEDLESFKIFPTRSLFYETTSA